MKVFLLAIIALLLYHSPDARNATSEILRGTADMVEPNTFKSDNPAYFRIPNPFHNLGD